MARKADHSARHVRGRARERRLRTFRGEILRAIRRLQASYHEITFPCVRYQDDPIGFVRDVLGVRLWSKQLEILLALCDVKLKRAPGKRGVVVRSGHKIGKSLIAVCAALWFFCCFPGARVLFTSTTAAQVDRILWRELRILCARSLIVIATDIPELARTGIRADDFREIFGFSSKEAEAVAGISGAQLLYIADEASGIPGVIFEAMAGNMMAGAIMLMLGNPTRNEGEFFDAFHGRSEFWIAFTVSSEDTPNCTGDEEPVPGLAEPEMIAIYEREHGRESAWFKVRILGVHALQEDGRVFSIQTITDSEQAWHCVEPEAADALFVGVDPAGPSGHGDEQGFAARRGLKVLEVAARRGLDPNGHLTEVLRMIRAYSPEGLQPVVVIDGGGKEGAKVVRAFYDFLHENPDAFRLVVIHLGDGAVRDVRHYDRMRDLLAGNLLENMKAGLGIPTDAKLSSELHVFEWRVNARGKQKLMPEKDGPQGVRRRLGRSPDRYDALALCCWEPADHLTAAAGQAEIAPAPPPPTNAFDARTARAHEPGGWNGGNSASTGDWDRAGWVGG